MAWISSVTAMHKKSDCLQLPWFDDLEGKPSHIQEMQLLSINKDEILVLEMKLRPPDDFLDLTFKFSHST